MKIPAFATRFPALCGVATFATALTCATMLFLLLAHYDLVTTSPNPWWVKATFLMLLPGFFCAYIIGAVTNSIAFACVAFVIGIACVYGFIAILLEIGLRCVRQRGVPSRL